MKNTPPLVKLPTNVQILLSLIQEELKSRKLFQALHEVGLDDCYFQPHLDSLILRFAGLDSSDETFAVYTDIMDRRSKKINDDHRVVTKQALKVYYELCTERKKDSNYSEAA